MLVLVGIIYIIEPGLFPTLYFRASDWFAPCSTPITYSIGSFDSRFGISRADFLNAINQAVQIWQKPINRNLFQYSPSGFLKINLIYDSRQQSTQRLTSLGMVINDDQDTFAALQSQYGTLLTDYNRAKGSLDSLVNNYNAEKTSYDSEVAYWNNQGGAPAGVASKLDQQLSGLNYLASQINQTQNNLNQLVDNVNALADTLNRLAYELNINANRYNRIGNQVSGPFEEGAFQSSLTNSEIDIYQFNNQDKLVRLLAHELGHALGLGHITNDPSAIMYEFNQGTNEKLTPSDVALLKADCRIK